jgi:hypothetical protein
MRLCRAVAGNLAARKLIRQGETENDVHSGRREANVVFERNGSSKFVASLGPGDCFRRDVASPRTPQAQL